MAALLNLAGTAGDSIVDGPGIRFTVFAQGCSFDCPGCHNPQTHEFGVGEDVSVDDLVERIRANLLVKGVTFSGGDPFFQAEGFVCLAVRLKGLGYEVASYTGFTWEKLVAAGTDAQKELLQHLDVLVDGPFVVSLRNLNLRFRGSENQRIIDVPKSLERFRNDPLAAPVLCTAKRWVG